MEEMICAGYGTRKEQRRLAWCAVAKEESKVMAVLEEHGNAPATAEEKFQGIEAYKTRNKRFNGDKLL